MKNSKLTNLTNARVSTAISLAAPNISLIGTGEYWVNKKIVNDIYLGTVALGSQEFSSNQLFSLQAIAAQCPLSGGEAVLRARDMLALAPDAPTFYNDDVLCGSTLKPSSEERSEPDLNENFVHIRPNPASEYIEIQYRFSTSKSDREFVLFDVFGKLVSTVLLKDVRGNQTIPLHDLPSGVYHYAVSGSSLSGNLIITH